jgi:drug/metabolite transporter (DMT)-like permease
LRPNKNLIYLHLTIFVWGFTAILGALISISAIPLVLFRMAIAFISLGIIGLILKKFNNVFHIMSLQLLGIGIIVAGHWIFFFHSIKVSNVSVALVSLSTAAMFASFIEPLLFKKKISWFDILASVVIIGIGLIFSIETKYTAGIIFGVLAALLASIFTTLNRKFVDKVSAIQISFMEMLGGFLGILIYTFLKPNFKMELPNYSDWMYLILLGTICTALAYMVAVEVMKELSAFTVILTTNLEPVYGIILALIIFGEKEQMNSGFYLGAFIILGTVFLYPVIKRRLKHVQANA